MLTRGTPTISMLTTIRTPTISMLLIRGTPSICMLLTRGTRAVDLRRDVSRGSKAVIEVIGAGAEYLR